MRSVLEYERSIVESDADARSAAQALLDAADAIYAPIAPMDTGFGEAKRLAVRLSSIAAHAFVYLAQGAGWGDEKLREVYEELKQLLEARAEPSEGARRILEQAGLGSYVARVAPEPREAVVKVLKEYVEPEEPQWPRRRRRAPRKPEPVAELRRLLRELGRSQPLLARAVQDALRDVVGVRA